MQLKEAEWLVTLYACQLRGGALETGMETRVHSGELGAVVGGGDDDNGGDDDARSRSSVGSRGKGVGRPRKA